MKRRYVTADVFTTVMFHGNPVAVVLDGDGLGSEAMQALAVEFNYTETTFVLPPRDPANTAWVRIFTPSKEIPFAGHPNIGTAFALARLAEARGDHPQPTMILEGAAGLVPVSLLLERGSVTGAELAAPEPLCRRARVTAARAAACLSLAPEDVSTDSHLPEVVSVGLPFLVVELASRDALRRIKPDGATFHGLLPLDGATAVYAYTRDVGVGTDPRCDFLSRMFTPRLTEDPATGSATSATVALLAELGGNADVDLAMTVVQGVDMGRPSFLLARASRRGGRHVSAHVGGRCVAVMSGTFEMPDRGAPLQA